MGFWDYVILIAVALLVALAVFLIVKRRKAGKCTCGECAGCPGCQAMKDRSSAENTQK
jgi:hypothetical protein